MKENPIIQKILEDANTDADKVIERAKAEASAMIEEHTQMLTKQANKELDKTREEAVKIKENEIANAELEARQSILAHKQEILRQIKEETKQRLNKMDGKEYVDYIEKMLDRIETKQGVQIVLPEKQKEEIKKLASEKGLVVSEEKRDIENGFILVDGKIEYNYEFKSILEFENEKIEKILSEILFN